ncbi:unnamed protein product [Caenorhabditis auriculariae]|uniref:Uncharacterized protein n=1 Tax=Caenorhabditis auriculariae TaxID=2777116 RepID=A0A8S1GQG5_9PELO|nr:unnamed protein product [Caenorhabditis auriculariae]
MCPKSTGRGLQLFDEIYIVDDYFFGRIKNESCPSPHSYNSARIFFPYNNVEKGGESTYSFHRESDLRCRWR